MDSIFNWDEVLEENYYQILGCDQSSTPEQILKEYKIRALVFHPDKNGNKAQSLEKFKKIQKAKNTLLNSEERKMYDKWLNSSLTIPFDRWLRLSNNGHASVHWMNKKSQKPMLPFHKQSESNYKWNRDLNDDSTLRRFRNYEI